MAKPRRIRRNKADVFAEKWLTERSIPLPERASIIEPVRRRIASTTIAEPHQELRVTNLLQEDVTQPEPAPVVESQSDEGKKGRPEKRFRRRLCLGYDENGAVIRRDLFKNRHPGEIETISKEDFVTKLNLAILRAGGVTPLASLLGVYWRQIYRWQHGYGPTPARMDALSDKLERVMPATPTIGLAIT